MRIDIKINFQFKWFTPGAIYNFRNDATLFGDHVSNNAFVSIKQTEIDNTTILLTKYWNENSRYLGKANTITELR